MDFAMVFSAIARFLEGRGLRLGIAGAHALHGHGHSRLTRDLDFVVDEAAKPALLPFLASLGFVQLHVSEGFSSHRHPDPQWGRVDFIYLDSRTADLLFGAASRYELFPGLFTLLPKAEHLVAMKCAALKADPSRFQDLADLGYLVQLPGIDEEKVRGYFERYGLGERFDELKRALRR